MSMAWEKVFIGNLYRHDGSALALPSQAPCAGYHPLCIVRINEVYCGAGANSVQHCSQGPGAMLGRSATSALNSRAQATRFIFVRPDRFGAWWRATLELVRPRGTNPNGG